MRKNRKGINMAAKKKTPASRAGTKKNTKTAKTTRKPAKKAAKKQTANRAPLHYSAVVVILVFIAIILGIFTYTTSAGALGGPVHNVLFGLFSSTAYLIPPAVLGLAVYVGKVQNTQRLTSKSVLTLLAIVLAGALIQMFTGEQIPVSSLYVYGMDKTGGGLLGGAVANMLTSLVGTFAAVVIVLFILFVILSVLFKVSIFSMVGTFFAGLFNLRGEIEEVEEKDTYAQGQKTRQQMRKIEERFQKKKLNAADLDFAIDDADEKSLEKKRRKKQADSAPEQPAEDAVVSEEEVQKRIREIVFNPDLPMDDEPVTVKKPAADTKKVPLTEPVQEVLPGAEEEASAPEPDTEPAPGDEKTQRVSTTTAKERAIVGGEIDQAITAPKAEYVYPSLNLLTKAKTASADKRREMYETANKLMDILKNFGVDAKLLQVTNGPTVTRYEIQPSTGVKLSKITGLAEDIALNLAVPTVLVAAVPGKAAVGIEVPNTSVNTVTVRELLESDAFQNAKSKLAVAFGKDIGGNVVVGDIAKMPHVLIAGSTGSGKSVCINTIITSILYKASPDEVKLIMVDPKVVELGVYNGIPHLLIPVVTDPKRAAGALNWAVGEMMKRYAAFAQTGTRNLEGYNKLMKKQGEETLPQIVIIIDELADLMMVAAKEVEDYICRLAQLARAAGIHLIIATQRPSVDVITALIKANVPSRIAFAVSSQVDSRTILDKGGAEKLLGKGDMLYHPTGLPSALRVQGAFVSDAEIESIVNFIKENSEETHYSEDLADHIDRCETGENGVTDEQEDGDALLPEAIELAVELGQISTAMIQRRLKVGYARAGRIIDQMEMRGIISGANGSKPREVFIDRIRMGDN